MVEPDDDMKKCNENLIKFVTEVDEAFKRYLKKGHINFAATIGALEGFKIYIIGLTNKLQKGEELKWHKHSPPNYIG